MISTVSFDYGRIAQGYAKDTPFLHGQVMERLTNKMKKRYQNGLDVGCGAGLSTKALRQICDKAAGVMLLQSNVIAQVEGQGKDIETVRQYLLEESARPYFASDMKEKLIFDGYSWYLRLQS